MRVFRKVTGHIIGLPAYKWMLQIGAPLIGTELELVLKSRWVLPTKILETGLPVSDSNRAERSFIRQLILLGKF